MKSRPTADEISENNLHPLFNLDHPASRRDYIR
jgi:hypothetical protein